MKAWKVYFKLAWQLKTPFILMLDLRYEYTKRSALQRFYQAIEGLSYIPEVRDCDNHAFIYKGTADRETNAVGIAIGFSGKTLHCWNIAMCKYDTFQIEPQTGHIFTKDKKYHALGVII